MTTVPDRPPLEEYALMLEKFDPFFAAIPPEKYALSVVGRGEDRLHIVNLEQGLTSTMGAWPSRLQPPFGWYVLLQRDELIYTWSANSGQAALHEAQRFLEDAASDEG